ncbi:HYR domain-containing protein, partial [Ulvibacter litoralis]|uniref:HYR domain-containing protein n=1 Tax=Ulvibacter litoralis TaxID=227084 RepID=UPI001679D18E
MKKITLTLIIMLFTALGFSQTTFNYTGSVQTYTVPAGVTEINIEAYGAQGEDNATASGGLGGFISGDLSVTPGEVLSIYVGGQDGFNGGGTEGTGSAMPGYNGVNGGGASDVRQNGTSLTDRIIVAGGGGGAGRGDCSNNNGGGGGYPGGLGGNSSNEPTNTGGTGTSTAGGDSGAGSCTGDCACSPGGGGGGGGDGGGAGGGYGISGGTIALGGTSGACGGNGDDTVGGLGSGGFGGCFGNGGDGGNTTNGGGAGGGGGWYGGGAGGGNWASGGGGGSSYILPSASNLASTNNSNPGNGVITITPLCTGLTITTTPSENVCPGTQVTITGVSSNGGIVTWDNGITNGVAFTATTTTTYTSSSTAPNDCVATVTITVEDTEDPIITCVADDTRDTDAGVCEYTVVGTEFDATFTDNCTNGSITNDLNGTATIAGEILPKGITTVLWTVNDGNGQSATCTTVITVEDNEAPIVTCIADDTRDTDPSVCQYTVIGTEFDATFTDNCSSGSITNNLNGTATIAGEILPKGITSVLWTVNDGNGQSDTCTTVITVEDNEDPIITCPAPITVTNDPGVCGAVVNYTAPVVTDNCASGTLGLETFSFTGSEQQFIVPPGITEIHAQVYGAQGGANWVNNVNFGGLVEADIPVTPGQILYIYVGEQPSTHIGGFNGGGAGEGGGIGGGGASDIRIGGNSITDRVIVGGGAGGAGYWSGQHIVGGLGGDLVGGPGYRDTPTNPGGDPGTQTESGNGTCTSFDNPIVSGGLGFGGSSIGCGCEGYGGGGGYYGGAGSGNCRGGGGGSSYTAPTATNVTHTQGVRSGHGEVIISYGATVLPIQTAGLPSGSVFPIGTTTNTFEVTDPSGNTASCSFDVTVEDNEAPVISCVADDTRDTDAGVCEYTVVGTEFDATFTDNCTSGTITNDLNGTATVAGEALPIGINTIIWTVNDGNGQSATCTTVITVEDNEAPIITCIADTTRNTDTGVCQYTVVGTEFDATFTDNCTSGSITNDLNGTATVAGEALPIGINTIIWTVNDGNGQSATCTTVITVEDNEAPIITCIADTTRNTDTGVCQYTVVGTEFDATFTDNCTSGSITNDLNGTATVAGEVLPIGITTVVWTVNDGNGQSATCTTVITVEDNEVPIITCVADTTRNTDTGVCQYTVVGTEFDATFTDNCTSGSITNDLTGTATVAGEVLPIGATTVVWTVNDGNGQSATCTTVIIVEDNETPIISCVANDTRDTGAGVCDYTVVGTEFDATFTDNCTSGTITNDLNGTA